MRRLQAAAWAACAALSCVVGCESKESLYEKAEAEYRAAEMAYYAVVASPSDKIDEAWEKAGAAAETAYYASLAALAPDALKKLTAAEKSATAAKAALIAAVPDEWDALKKTEKAARWLSPQSADYQETEEAKKAVVPNEMAALKAADEAFKAAKTAHNAAEETLKTTAPDAFDEYQNALSERLGPVKITSARDALWKAASKEVAAWRASSTAMREAQEKRANAVNGAHKALETAAKEAKEVLKAAATMEMAAWIAANTKFRKATIEAHRARNDAMIAAAKKKWAKVMEAENPDDRYAAYGAFIAAAPAEWNGWLEAERDMHLAANAALETRNDGRE